MGYAGRVKFRALVEDYWKDLRDNVSIYEVELPTFEEVSKLSGTFTQWSFESEEAASKHYYYGNSFSSARLAQILKVYSNPKGTVKVVVLAGQMVALVSRDSTITGFSSVETGDAVGFGILKEGYWAVLGKSYYDNDKELSIVSSDISDLDVGRSLNVLSNIAKIYGDCNSYSWGHGERGLRSNGIISLQEVRAFRTNFLIALRRVHWTDWLEKMQILLEIRDKVTITDDAKRWKIKMDAVDGKVYSYECNTAIRTWGKDDFGIYDPHHWLSFVSLKHSDNRQGIPASELLVRKLIQEMLNEDEKRQEPKTIEANGRTLTFSIERTAKNAKMCYLNGILTKNDDLYQKAEDFMLNGTPIVPTRAEAETTVGAVRTGLSKEAQRMIDTGLNGTMNDLEGELPFHLNLIYREKKWYIEVAGKEYYVPGGMSALQKVKSAVKGTAVIERERYNWEEGGRNGTRLIRDRLAELIGEDNALDVILTVKKMGALYKVMGAEGKSQ